MSKDLNVRPETLVVSSFSSGLVIILDLTPKAKETKAKINKWDYIKLKCFCIVKETINKMKRQPTEWEKIFANYVSDKVVISKVYKELIQLTKKKTIRLKNGQRI